MQGPGERTDEGGSEVDLFTEGMTSIDKERMVTLDLLWKEVFNLLNKVTQQERAAMRKRREASNPDLRNAQPVTVFNAPYDSGIYDAASRLARAFNKMAKFKSESYIPYTHSMWDTVNQGAVNKQASGLWDAIPQFKKTGMARTLIGDMPPRMRCTRCNAVYDRPVVPPATKIWCKACTKQTLVDFRHAA